MSLTKGTTGIVKGFTGVIDVLTLGLESHSKLQGLLLEFGWVTPIDSADMAAVDAALAIKSVLEDIRDLSATLQEEDADELAILEDVLPLLKSVYETINSISATPPVAGMPFPLDQADFWDQMQNELPEYLVHRYFEEEQKIWFSILHFLGILDRETVMPEGDHRTHYVRRRVHYDRIITAISNPAQLFTDVYNWGDGNMFNHHRFLPAVEKILEYGGYAATLIRPEISLLQEYYAPTNRHQHHVLGLELPIIMIPTPHFDGAVRIGVMLMPIPPADDDEAAPQGFMITPLFEGTLENDTKDAEHGVMVSVDGQFELNGLVRFNILPVDSNVDLDASQATISGGIAIQAHPKKPWYVIGDEEGFYIKLEGVYGAAKLQGSIVDPEFIVELGTSDKETADAPKLVVGINFGEGDGFISKLFGGKAQEVALGGKLAWSSKHGLTANGQVGFKIQLASHLSLGPVQFMDIELALEASGNDAGLTLGADVKAELGPFTALIENMGMQLLFKNDAEGGVFGDLDMEFGFKPPNGIALSLDAGAVKGGGYLMLDYEAGMYAGAIELEFEGLFGFTAIGVINTKFPDGSKGYSLLLLVNVTFGTPIALGFNFYLSGIGGIIGLHRTMSTQALQKGVKDGSVSNILFPENAVANIHNIISDIQAIFPIKQDQFVLGLMARITWNTPAILTIDAGFLIEFPNPVKVAIVGVIRCLLPDPDNAIIKLNVAFLGVIDFEKKLLMFDASIFDSRILTITLEGDMALRMSWGTQKDFLVSLGGFHPAYTPPGYLQLPDMRRMTVNILSGNPNLVLTAYFALTTNTIQFGAELKFSFKISKFGVYGNLGFDVLIQFSPFRFMAEIRAGVDLKLGSSKLFSIGLKFNLEGPAPWRANGYAKFEIFWITFKVKFDKTWGEKKENTLPGTSVLPLLTSELSKNENWLSEATGSVEELVTYANAETVSEAVIVKPFGTIAVNQSVVPLDIIMTKFGNFRPEDISKVTITRITLDPSGNPETFSGDSLTDLQNSFAPSAYKELKDEDKLTAPSYEDQNSGVKLGELEYRNFDYGINRIVEYEAVLSDYETLPVVEPIRFASDMFKPFISGGAVGKSALSQKKKQQLEAADTVVKFSGETYAVVNTATLANVATNNLVFDSKSAADEYLKAAVAADPALQNELQLTPTFQMD